jgi:hypothetical protein
MNDNKPNWERIWKAFKIIFISVFMLGSLYYLYYIDHTPGTTRIEMLLINYISLAFLFGTIAAGAIYFIVYLVKQIKYFATSGEK